MTEFNQDLRRLLIKWGLIALVVAAWTAAAPWILEMVGIL